MVFNLIINWLYGTRKVTKVYLSGNYKSILFDRDLKDFMAFIKGKKWIKFNDRMINANNIVYFEEIDY